jgi:spore maturation protein CgeB
MKVVIAGLSITSSWGNGHATNYRALVAELSARGHEVLFCERDAPWYDRQRDLPELPNGRLCLYGSLGELKERAGSEIADADLVIVGSYVPQGVEVCDLVLTVAGGMTAFYDIDTPVTLAKLAAGDHEYLAPAAIPRFDLYLSFTGGPTLGLLERDLGARRAVAFHCFVDPNLYRPAAMDTRWEVGYLGTFSGDRQPHLEALLLGPARRLPGSRFVVAGSQYPANIAWPQNVERIEHLAPADHPRFYSSQRFALNITRDAMRKSGWSPSVRLFEAAACGVPVISDSWPGLDELFTVGEEIFVADSGAQVNAILAETREDTRAGVAARARDRVLRDHTAARRVDQLEQELAAATKASAVST